jgi:hypothetical protein
MSIFTSLFGKKQSTGSGDLNNKSGANANESNGSANKESEADTKYGAWAFLAKIIEYVTSKFSKQDQEEVKTIGRRLNELGAKFVGEIKIGTTSRSMGVEKDVAKNVDTNSKSR